MTEEIIINGVNVAGCEFSCENPLHEIKYSCNVRGYEKDDGLHIHFKCKNNPNCYYKQLKRSEQENKELRQQYNCYACDTCQGKEDYRNMKRHCENAIKTVHIYRSALEEIREIASPHCSQCVEIIDKINEVLNNN